MKRFFRAVDKIVIFYQIIILTIIIFNYGKISHNRFFLMGHIVIISFVLLLNYYSARSKWISFLRDWNIIPFILYNFFELHYLINNVCPKDMDDLLIRIDYFIFGHHPTVWLEKLHHPLLTEYLQWVYASFYFLPFILAVLLYRAGRREHFDYFAYMIVFGFYLSYLGYFLVPAIGPRFTLQDLQHSPLQGIWLAEYIKSILNNLEGVQRDAFPSGHTEITLITLYFAAKYHKSYFRFILLIGISLLFSTVYLRYHYVIDVMAGAVLALLVISIGPYLYKWLEESAFLNLAWHKYKMDELLVNKRKDME